MTIARYWHNVQAHRRNNLRNVRARLLVDAETTKNMVTIDDVISVCLALRRSGTAAGKTYNIVNRNNLTIGQIGVVIQRLLKITGYVADPSLTGQTVKGGSIVERVAFRYTRLFWPYALNSEPDWETTNTDNLSVPRVTMTTELFEFLISHFVRSLAMKEVVGSC